MRWAGLGWAGLGVGWGEAGAATRACGTRGFGQWVESGTHPHHTCGYSRSEMAFKRSVTIIRECLSSRSILAKRSLSVAVAPSRVWVTVYVSSSKYIRPLICSCALFSSACSVTAHRKGTFLRPCLLASLPPCLPPCLPTYPPPLHTHTPSYPPHSPHPPSTPPPLLRSRRTLLNPQVGLILIRRDQQRGVRQPSQRRVLG